ncbi:MAG TPA: hypothetical protein EYQ73_05165 [Candidatus Poseidoniales archaeon]|jgi:hypothetical protein|nr:MAG: hypothetical protein CXT71_08065 [Euryarchaeota archaeon]HIF46168.1 hypothetical protein [Candidatus Poseidoniales archaeon]HIL65252.1 hypothetical protein [Candidatus Poseidoniales archaeon]
MSTAATWEERCATLDASQREIISGGSLSRRFSQLPLWLSHPGNIGGFYGLLVALSLILPYKMTSEHWLPLWILHASLLIFSTMLLGMVSRFMCAFTKRLPVPIWRHILYPMPFVGLAFFTITATGLLLIPAFLSWTMLMLPGPLYVHLAWAPRWRMLCMLEDDIDPFEGIAKIDDDQEKPDCSGEDAELKEVVEEFDSEE